MLLEGDCGMWRRVVLVGLAMGGSAAGQRLDRPAVPEAKPVPAWIAKSNGYTKTLLDVQLKHSPESASQQGLAQYDTRITDPTRADEIVQRRELEQELAKLKAAEATEKDPKILEDLAILRKAFDLQFRQDDYQ